MRAYSAYIEQLRTLIAGSLRQQYDLRENKEINEALNGQPSQQLRRLISLDMQRAAGAFFTGEKLAGRASRLLKLPTSPKPLIVDPACGVGDLLLACSRSLPISKDLKSTLDKWGRQLAGYDLHQEFIDAAKARLALAAIRRGVPVRDMSLKDIEQSLPNIQVRDGLSANDHIHTATHIILNPPYTTIPAPKNCAWGAGIVSAAAVFLDVWISRTVPGTRIVAILPDVLRTGSRYEKWRGYVRSLATISNIRIVGQFDRWADVDVFLLSLTVGGKLRGRRRAWWTNGSDGRSVRVKDYFDVCVGPVVPHRDPQAGPVRPYIFAKASTPWGTIKQFLHHRNYEGRAFRPPFVVVRRTSRPGDRERAVGTIVMGKRLVAIENHLVVLLPQDKSYKRCTELLKVLKSPRTSNWLNRRIRCRHLTTTALRELPYQDV